MTTSFTRTRTQIAQRVLGKVLKIGATSTVSADYDTVYEAIDLRLKEMHRKGLFWRKVTSVPVTFSLSSSVATLSAGAGDILFPLKITWADGSYDQPIELIGPKEYAAITDKTRYGQPEKIMWKGGSEFISYPVPSADGTGKLLYEKIADDSSAGAAIDIDVAMIRAMMDIIKYDVADDFGIDEAMQLRWRGECEKAERDIRALNALHVDLSTVRVDDYDTPSNNRFPTDYGWIR